MFETPEKCALTVGSGCGGLELALPLHLYVLEPSLNVVLEELRRFLEERVQVSLRVLQLEVKQVVQPLKARQFV